MASKIRAQVIYNNPPDVVLKELLEAQKEAMKVALIFHHGNLLKKHFTREGAREYKYQRRTRKHEIRKQKKLGHNNPLVWTGELKEAALGQRPQPQGAGKRGAKLQLRGLPRHTYFINKGKGGKLTVDKNRELLTVSKAEEEILRKRILADVDKDLERLSARRTVTIGPTGSASRTGIGIQIS